MKVFPDQQILSLFSLAFLISAPLGGELKEEDIWSTAENPSYADAFRFVGAFAAQWPPLPKASYSFWEAYLNFNFVVASFHAPFFSVESQNAGASIRGTAEAIWRDRESGELPSLDSRTSKGQPRARLREQRISLWTKAWIGAKGRNELPRRSHSTLLLTDFRGYYVDEAEYKRLKSSYPADGLVMFQMALLRLLGMWESEWNRVLDEIDKCVRVTVCGTFRIVVELTNFMQIVDILDPDERQKLMFDNSFDCSEVYFAVLQLLRIFDDWIHEAAIEIERFDRLFESDATLRRLGADANTLCENWQLVSQDFLEAQERLEERLKGKTEELKSLRDRVSIHCTRRLCIRLTDLRTTALQCNFRSRGI